MRKHFTFKAACVSGLVMKRVRSKLAVIAVAGLTLSVSGRALSEGAFDYPKNADAIKNAEHHVMYVLTDPDSAKFRNVQMHGNTACGEVNSKNQMGGYTGYQGFVDVYARMRNGPPPILRPAWDDDGSQFQDVWQTACG